MASDENKFNGTDLIDVGEIPTDFDEDLTREKGAEISERHPAYEPRAAAGGMLIADVKDRFAALFIDLALLYCIYWFLLLPYRAIAFGSAAGPIPAWGKSGLIFNGIFLLVAFLWFTLQEFAFSASIGKFLCHLTVRKLDGSPASLASAALRTILLPIDIVLSPILIPLACMEWSAWHRRLGDLVGGTVVIRKLGRPSRQYALSLDIVSSATRRAIAFIFDLALILAFSFGYALMLSPDQPLVSMIMVVLFPLLLLAFITLPEWLTYTSPGKWIFGLTICHEDGSSIDLSTALIRNLWRIFDCNPIGFLTCMFAVRKQRPGDTAAGSLVIAVSREWRGLIGLVCVVIVSAAVLYAGSSNRTNLLKSDFEINFLPSLDVKTTSQKLEQVRMRNLGIRNFIFAAESPDSERKPAILQPGEMLYMVFDVGGFTLKDGKAWVQEDLNISYPDGSVGLKLQNINDFNQKLSEQGPIRFENNISLPDKAQPGRYTVTITLRDKLSRREIKEQRFFYITPAETGAPVVE
ncbi:MAG: RDD family protein [Pseudomonadota bacterium]